MSWVSIEYDSKYIKEMMKNSNGHKKAMGFFLYVHNTNAGVHLNAPSYAKLWCVSRSTAWVWLNEFKEMIGMRYIE